MGTGIVVMLRLWALKKSRAVKVNGQYSSVENTPKEFVELLCGGARPIRTGHAEGARHQRLRAAKM